HRQYALTIVNIVINFCQRINMSYYARTLLIIKYTFSAFGLMLLMGAVFLHHYQQDSAVDITLGAPLVMGFMGALFFLVGFSIILVGYFNVRKKRYLQQHGIAIQTKFHSTSINADIAVNGRHPWVIYTKWHEPGTNELHEFKSENLWFDPTEYIEQGEITVLIEKGNPKKYYVDVSFLPYS
ncbi:MAG: hypothetical protein AAF512_20190, partial [Pseudomonadota bacterium]